MVQTCFDINRKADITNFSKASSADKHQTDTMNKHLQYMYCTSFGYFPFLFPYQMSDCTEADGSNSTYIFHFNRLYWHDVRHVLAKHNYNHERQ